MNFHQIVILIAIVWYVVTAWFSSGYIQLDEHYQIIEFAGYINGWNDANDLAWEFNSQIRSSIQPYFAALILKFCGWINVTNPFSQAFALRLLTALFSVFSITIFVNSVKSLISKKFWKPFILLSYFIWFLPYINVRFSSETWSGLFLLLSISILITKNKNLTQYWWIGILLGLSFLFRFQAGIVIATIGCWLLIKDKISLINIAMISLGFIFIFFLGVISDFFFYGNLTITPWNYFYVNLIEGVASNFGVSPFYFYFQEIYFKSFIPFGVLIFTSIIIAIIKKREELIFWIVLIFIISHSLISHKEFRFIFPIINLLPIFIIWSLEEINKLNLNITKGKAIIIFVFLISSVNTIGLIVASTTPPSSGIIEIAKQISLLEKKKNVNFMFTGEANPYAPWNCKANFYLENNLNTQKIFSKSRYSNSKISQDTTDVFAFSINDSNRKIVKKIINNLNLKYRGKNVSNWALPFFLVYNAHDKNVILLYSN